MQLNGLGAKARCAATLAVLFALPLGAQPSAPGILASQFCMMIALRGDADTLEGMEEDCAKLADSAMFKAGGVEAVYAELFKLVRPASEMAERALCGSVGCVRPGAKIRIAVVPRALFDVLQYRGNAADDIDIFVSNLLLDYSMRIAEPLADDVFRASFRDSVDLGKAPLGQFGRYLGYVRERGAMPCDDPLYWPIREAVPASRDTLQQVLPFAATLSALAFFVAHEYAHATTVDERCGAGLAADLLDIEVACDRVAAAALLRLREFSPLYVMPGLIGLAYTEARNLPRQLEYRRSHQLVANDANLTTRSWKERADLLHREWIRMCSAGNQQVAQCAGAEKVQAYIGAVLRQPLPRACVLKSPGG